MIILVAVQCFRLLSLVGTHPLPPTSVRLLSHPSLHSGKPPTKCALKHPSPENTNYESTGHSLECTKDTPGWYWLPPWEKSPVTEILAPVSVRCCVFPAEWQRSVYLNSWIPAVCRCAGRPPCLSGFGNDRCQPVTSLLSRWRPIANCWASALGRNMSN